MAKKKGNAKVTVLGTQSAIMPIARGRDNTDDLNAAVDAVHARHSHLKAPVGTLSKSPRKGVFNPTDNTAFNGNQVTAPPQG